MSSPMNNSNVVPLKPVRARRPKAQILFTDAWLERLKPTGRGAVYYDTRAPLAVRVTPSGAKSFMVYRWVAGSS